jgi:putative transposase
LEKRYNFRIYPNAEQDRQIQKNFGCCRFVYNRYLAKRIEAHKNESRILSFNECCLDLTRLKQTEGYEWLGDADANSLQAALKDLDNAYKAFFRRAGQGGEAPGFPKFKSKRGNRQAYRSRKSICRSNIEIDAAGKRIKLTKLGWTRCKVSRDIEGRILSATVFQSRSGKYFVSVCCTDTQPRHLPKTGADIGLHLGFADLVTTSDGEHIENPRYLEKSAKKIARLRRRLSRKPKDSRNREKARIKMARAYEKVTNQRNDMLNKLSMRLVRDCDTICVKDVDVAKLREDRRFSKLAGDAGWGELMRQLRYKSLWYGKEFVLVDKLLPSARTCSACGFESAEVGRNNRIREWDCPRCGARHDRGVNAALSVLNAALGCGTAPETEKPERAGPEESGGKVRIPA